jgi:hypothetical protein
MTIGGVFSGFSKKMHTWLKKYFCQYSLQVGAGACLLPFVVLAFYSHPALDDFSIGQGLRTRSVWQYAADVYVHTSGRYAASLSSVVIQYFGRHPAAYQWLVLAGLLGLVGGLYLAAAAAVPAGNAHLASSIGSVLVVAALLNFPKPADSIYWLTGEVAYLYPVVLMTLLVALLAWLAARPRANGRVAAWVAAVALAAYIPGFSEITALLLPLVVAGLWLALQPRQPGGGCVAVSAAAILGSVLTLGTPAHHGRWQALGQPAPVLLTAGRAGFHAAYSVVNWLGNGLLPLCLLLALPLSVAFTRAAGDKGLVQRITRPVWLWPLLTGAGLWLSFFFYHLTMHDGLVPRVKNLLYLYFVAGCVLSTHAAYRRLRPRYQAVLLATPARIGLGLWLLVAFFSDHNPSLLQANYGQGQNAVLQAYYDWLSSAAARYDQQQQARYALVRAAVPSPVPLRLAPLHTTPLSLFHADIAPNPTGWPNVAYARFFYYPAAVYVAEPTQ